MIKLLGDLNRNGDPSVNFHWNKRLSKIYEAQIAQAPPENKIAVWYQYCAQLLNAGENGKCIAQLENVIKI